MNYYRYFKRISDLVIALIALLIVSPVLLIVTLLLLVFQKGHVYFVQPRVGKNERIFKIIKFKTMNEKKNTDGDLLSDKERLTSVGKFIRKTSLDELPQLINILKGDMSFVGPRPLLVEYLNHYDEVQRTRHHVMPGITGWAQINGRNSISWQEKFKFDVWYVQNQSFFLDSKILYLTFTKVIKAEGINSKEGVTMEKFKGN